jgi:TusA-related sulfurtransferase
MIPTENGGTQMTANNTVKPDRELDVKGAKCPLPIVKARQELNQLQVGQVLKVLATDPGSVNDFKGWVKAAKNVELVGQEQTQEGGQTVYVHLIRRKG